jgi:hypothetical protein
MTRLLTLTKSQLEQITSATMLLRHEDRDGFKLNVADYLRRLRHPASNGEVNAAISHCLDGLPAASFVTLGFHLNNRSAAR